MRNLLLTSATLLCIAIHSNAQITITSADMPSVGDTFHSLRDPLPLPPGFSIGQAGPNRTWDFSTLDGTVPLNTYAVTPASTPYGSNFPNANLALTNDHVGYIFYKNTSTALKIEGLATIDASLGSIIIVYSPVPDQYRFPTTYPNNFSGTTGFQNSKDYDDLPPAIQHLIDSLASGVTVYTVRVRNTTTYTDTIDAWGKVTTPIGTYDALRRKRVENATNIIDVEIQGVFGPQWVNNAATRQSSSTSYSWLASVTEVPLVTLEYDTSNNITSVTYSTTPPPPGASFTWNNPAGGMVNFTNTSQNNPSSFYWDFGDQGASSTLENPSHNYASNGTYHVCLTVTNQSGNDTSCQNVVVTGIVSATITTGAITGSPFCADSALSVPFTITGSFNNGNIFTAQLSDAAGSFAFPNAIGTLAGTASGTINAVIPSGTPVGTGYRIRVVSDNPAITGTDNGSNLEVKECGLVGCTAIPSLTPSSCIPQQLPAPGLSDSLTCIVRGEQVNIVLYFKNFDTLGGITIEWLRIDSITNLPCGITLAMNDPDHTYVTGENGCMSFSGLTNDSAGQYKLGIWISVKVSILPLPISGEAGALSQQFGGPPFSYYITVNESGDPCPGSTATISGTIFSEDMETVGKATVNATGSSSQSYLTGMDGSFSFVVNAGDSITITPSKNNDSIPNNGITTFDIIMIQRQILAIQPLPLNTPYKILSADVNGSSTVSTLDIVLMRSVILAKTTSFPGGKLWAFVPDDYVFPSPDTPYNHPASRTIASVNSNLNSQDFIGMKLGDVNNNWDPSTPKAGTVGEVQFAMDDRAAMPGEEIVVPVKVKDFRNVTGYQFTMSWNPEVLDFVEAASKTLNGYFGTTHIDRGFLTTSWNDEMTKGISLDENAVVFELKFKAVGAIGTSSEIKIGSELTVSEAYNGNLDFLEVNSTNSTVKVGNATSRNTQHATPITLSVQPNPFTNSTRITFEIPKEEMITIVIYDVHGKAVKHLHAKYQAGLNETEWNGSDDAGNSLSSGVYHVRVMASGFAASKKIIRMN